MARGRVYSDKLKTTLYIQPSENSVSMKLLNVKSEGEGEKKQGVISQGEPLKVNWETLLINTPSFLRATVGLSIK